MFFLFIVRFFQFDSSTRSTVNLLQFFLLFRIFFPINSSLSLSVYILMLLLLLYSSSFVLFSYSNVKIINKEVASFVYSQHNAHRSCYISVTMNLLKILRKNFIVKKSTCAFFYLSFSYSLCCLIYSALLRSLYIADTILKFYFHFVNYSGLLKLKNNSYSVDLTFIYFSMY